MQNSTYRLFWAENQGRHEKFQLIRLASLLMLTDFHGDETNFFLKIAKLLTLVKKPDIFNSPISHFFENLFPEIGPFVGIIN